jgi:hypothetical protein
MTNILLQSAYDDCKYFTLIIIIIIIIIIIMALINILFILFILYYNFIYKGTFDVITTIIQKFLICSNSISYITCAASTELS